MGRYSKVYSNYVLREKHQNTSLGEIFERDFSTIGERHNIAPGKKRFYFDGNMLFTINNTNFPQNRENNGSWVCSYMYPDVKNVVTDINNVKVNSKSNNICDFCYFGSAFDIIRASVEHIVESFPASIVSQQDILATTVSKDLNNETYEELIDDEYKYLMFNPFGIDFINQSPILGEYDNELRHFPITWNKYVVNFNDNGNKWVEPIIDYDFNGTFYTGCVWDESFQRIGTIKLKTRQFSNEPRFIELHAYLINGETILTTKETVRFEIKPNENVINEFFNNLDSFEKQLLNRESKPLYSNHFITPIQRENGWYKYPLRTYTWPLISGSDYCIDISSNTYEDYIYSLTDLADTLDDIKCDNIWRCMTHESIKNFDWTYTRAINEEMEEEFFEGGERMKSVLRLIGRTFDDVKHYVDGIAMSSNIDYSNFNIAPDAEMSDKAEMQGWDILTTSWTDCNNAHPSCYEKPMLSNMYLGGTCWDGKTNAPLIDKINPWIDKNPKYVHSTWYKGRNYENLNNNNIDVEFMKRLYLSSRRIFQSKGTEQGIEMILGMFGFERDVDYKMYQRSHSLKPIPLNETYYFYEKVPYDNNQKYTKHKELPIFGLTANSDEYIQVEKNNNIEYYRLNGNYTAKELVDEAITNKMKGHFYEEDGYLGVPLSDYYFYNKEYLIPYFTDKEFYDGNFYFQSKGGWGKRSISNRNDYLETLSYLKVYKNITDMLSQEGFELEENMICYVSDYSDYLLYSNTLPDDISHYFKLVNALTYDEFNSWKYIPMEGDIVNVVNYVNEDGITHDDYLHAKYLDSIKSTDFGNNPHVGYGKYDMGQEYLEYMKKPFKFIVDEGDFYTPEDYDKANSLRFDIKNIENDDKIKVLTQPYKLITDETLINELQKETYVESNYSKIDFENLPIEVQEQFKENPSYHTFGFLGDNAENSGYNYIKVQKYKYLDIIQIDPTYSYENYSVNTNFINVDNDYIINPNDKSYDFVEVNTENVYLPINNINTFGYKDEEFPYKDENFKEFIYEYKVNTRDISKDEADRLVKEENYTIVKLLPDANNTNLDNILILQKNRTYVSLNRVKRYADKYKEKIYENNEEKNKYYKLINKRLYKKETNDENGNELVEFYERNKIKNLYINFLPKIINEDSPKYIKLVNTTFDGKPLQEEFYGIDDTYYLNDKLLVIENLNQVDVYKEYFMNYISHYLMQMIPSTTLLVFKNFNLGKDENKKVTITASTDGKGFAIGGGTYNIGDTITLNAIPKPGYNFQYWIKNDEKTPIMKNNIFIYAISNDTYKAFFNNFFIIEARSYDDETGTVSGGRVQYLPNEIATFTAKPNKGYKFVEWVKGNYVKYEHYSYKNTIDVKADQFYLISGGTGLIAIFEKITNKSVKYSISSLPNIMRENISVFIDNKEVELNGDVFLGSTIDIEINNTISTDGKWEFKGWYKKMPNKDEFLTENFGLTFEVQKLENIEIISKYIAVKDIEIVKKINITDENGKLLTSDSEAYKHCKISSSDFCNLNDKFTATAVTDSNRYIFDYWDDNINDKELKKEYNINGIGFGINTFEITGNFKEKEEKIIIFINENPENKEEYFLYNFESDKFTKVDLEKEYNLYELLDNGFTEVVTSKSLTYLQPNDPHFSKKDMELQIKFMDKDKNIYSYNRLDLKQNFMSYNEIYINFEKFNEPLTFNSNGKFDLILCNAENENISINKLSLGQPIYLPKEPEWINKNNYFIINEQDPKIKFDLVLNNGNRFIIPKGKIAYSDLVSNNIFIELK